MTRMGRGLGVLFGSVESAKSGYTSTIAVSNRMKGIDDVKCPLSIKLRPASGGNEARETERSVQPRRRGLKALDSEDASPNP